MRREKSTWLDCVLGGGTLSVATTVKVKSGRVSRSRLAPEEEEGGSRKEERGGKGEEKKGEGEER